MKMNEVAGTKPNPSRLRLWLVDDDDDMRTLIADLIGRSDSIECSQQFYSAEAALDALAHELPPDILLLDLNMGGMSGTEAIRPIKRLSRDTRVFIMTIFYDSVEIARAHKAGAAGFILKREDWNETIEQLRNSSTDWTADAPAAPVLQPAHVALSVLPTIEYCRP